MVPLKKLVEELKERNVCVFEEHHENRLFMMKFHLLDPLCMDLSKFGSVIL